MFEKFKERVEKMDTAKIVDAVGSSIGAAVKVTKAIGELAVVGLDLLDLVVEDATEMIKEGVTKAKEEDCNGWDGCDGCCDGCDGCDLDFEDEEEDEEETEEDTEEDVSDEWKKLEEEDKE